MKHWRESASLIVTALSTSAEKQLNNAKILLLRRNTRSSFMPSQYVFPGGVTQNVDLANQWKDLFEEVTQSPFSKIIEKLVSANKFNYDKSLNNNDILDITYRICAIRETFEECGLLFVANRNSWNKNKNDICHSNLINAMQHQQSISTWRAKIQEDELNFYQMCKQYYVIPNIWLLQDWSNWLTPTFEKIRFNTFFYLCILSTNDNLTNVTVDGKEIIHSLWLPYNDLQNLLNNEYVKDIKLPPPQFYEISRLLRYKCIDEIDKYINGNKLIRNIPSLIVYNDCIAFILPGDYEYPNNIDLLNDDKRIRDSKYDDHPCIESKPLRRILIKDGNYKLIEDAL